jgi:hypothetical protein
MEFPEVASVFAKAGGAGSATDPAPLEMVETVINLKPPEQWRKGETPEKLLDDQLALRDREPCSFLFHRMRWLLPPWSEVCTSAAVDQVRVQSYPQRLEIGAA